MIKDLKSLNLSEAFYFDLAKFQRSKQRYLKEPTITNSGLMKLDYDLVYTDAKQQWNAGVISEATFWEIVETLKEGLE